MFSDTSDLDPAHCSSSGSIVTSSSDVIAHLVITYRCFHHPNLATPTLPPRNCAGISNTLATQAQVEQTDVSALQDQVRQLVRVNEELRMGLQHEKTTSQRRSNYEDTVSTLYDSLALPDRIAYLTRRLRTEPLHHSLRLSVALDREQALATLAQEREAALGAEVETMLSMIEHKQNLKTSQGPSDEHSAHCAETDRPNLA
ncbi:BZ3500_MvSof-1268-A1-R1_Chr1-3g02391 [Microbotryum saponariae]|uniref:BZ3500_MvSof-1268-A1-R1_Chr1-3g02391 protein n=1 Tax=Microbotryum saponariae TaxID=289078 RepID=A0A2X0KUX8_9BASI|nr:BZ3500_MvSof-1268-A1-R1_Chr1-3g02391 [Microbotryum saponariae]SCZ96178.1 BZ3501_MvSof-1269-A2-R1_Chr1-3g01994 [Microbotryum saponariae]